MADSSDAMRWVWRGVTGATLLFGWLFILYQNKFHLDPPVVIVMLGYLAVVLTITNLWRVGASAVEPVSDDDWGRPLGERGELEKEKRTLLKSIKEAEFDLAMGKLSKVDAEQLIQMYRARAIEVIKELDRLDAGAADTPREAIRREVAARLAIEAKAAEGKKKKPVEKTEKPVEKTEKPVEKAEKTVEKTEKPVEKKSEAEGTVQE